MKTLLLRSLALLLLTGVASTGQESDAPKPDMSNKVVPYVATPEPVLEKMLDMGQVGEGDVVYDLGSGDGRIVIAAARRGARGIGIELDPKLLEQSRRNAERAGVADKVEFRQQDIFTADFRDATVVTMYLFPAVNLRLRPRILRELKPGTRIVSHSFDMGDWQPEETVVIEGKILHRWTVPSRP